jgi:hypothetical protein
MPRRENAGRRAGRAVEPRQTILIYCGGVRTERDYFNALRRHMRRSNMTVRVRQDGVAPEALVRAAAAFRDRQPGVFDEVWCVVDTDEFDIEAAVASANQHRVSLAVSNPCFELWLLLHHSDCPAYCNGCAEVLRRLRRHVPGYDKRQLDFSRFSPGIEDAVGRAQVLEPTGTAYGKNPSSGVWQIVQRILEPR